MSLSKDKKLSEERKFDLLFKNNIDIENRVIRLTGYIGHPEDGDDKEPYFDFNFVDSALTLLEQQSNRKSITIKINSGGGLYYEGQAILGRITASPCHIVTEGYGQIMSAACLILASGNMRKMSKYATFMCHESSYGIAGKHSEVLDYVRQQEREDDFWCKWMSEFSKYPKDSWKNLIKKRDFYMSAQECLDAGIIDKIL